MAIKKSLNNPNKPAAKTKTVKLPAKMGGGSTSINTKTGTAKYPGGKGFATATGATVKGYKKGDVGEGKMFSTNSSKKMADRTVVKYTKKGTALGTSKRVRAERKGQ